MRHLGNPSGSIRHWQPLLSRYNTALKTSYKSTVRGLVRFRTCSNNGRTLSNCSRLTSLGYCFPRSMLQNYRLCLHLHISTLMTSLPPSPQKIVNRLLESMLKRQFGFDRVRYRGLAKNHNRLCACFALVNNL